MEIVKRPHARNMIRLAQRTPKILVLSADLTSSCEVNDFRDLYPDRFYSMGLAEQNMISFAAGLAREGFFPYVHTFAVFICRRAFDQVAMSIAYPNLKVRLIGFLPGITTPGGVTHQAIDDIGLMRLLPNMHILECGDATEVESVLDVAQDLNGPVYIRMLRGEVPRLFPAHQPMQFNQARNLFLGSDITVISSGICTEEAIKAIPIMRNNGVSVNHMHVSTLKPFHDPQVLEAIASAKLGIITMENHTIIGGLGSAIAEIIAEKGMAKQLIRLGLKDEYAHGASRSYLMKKYSLDGSALLLAGEQLTGSSFDLKTQPTESPIQPDISVSPPKSNRPQNTNSTVKPEDL